MERELKSPEEIVRSLRLCVTDCFSCKDGDGVLCSYFEGRSSFPQCMDAMMGDAADLIAATYRRKE